MLKWKTAAQLLTTHTHTYRDIYLYIYASRFSKKVVSGGITEINKVYVHKKQSTFISNHFLFGLI